MMELLRHLITLYFENILYIIYFYLGLSTFLIVYSKISKKFNLFIKLKVLKRIYAVLVSVFFITLIVIHLPIAIYILVHFVKLLIVYIPKIIKFIFNVLKSIISYAIPQLKEAVHRQLFR